MLKKPKSKVKTVAEKVADLIAHPNQSGSDSDSADEATAPKVIDFDEDEYQMPEARTTEFRKQNVKLLSEQSSKYKGKIASRKDYEEDEEDGTEYEESDDEDEEVVQGDAYEESDEENEEGEDLEEQDSDSDANDMSLKAFSKKLKQNYIAKDESEGEDDDIDGKEDSDNDENGQEHKDDDEDDDDDEEDDDDDDEEDDDELENEDEEETEVISKVNHEAEIQKGVCVQNQLRLWERLLELRINSQKFLSKTNQLPAPMEIKNLASSNDKNKAVIQETTKQTKMLLQNLVSLQDALYTQFSELDKAMKPSLKRTLPFKEHNKGEPPLKQVNTYLQERFDTFRSYRNTILLKWDDRTKLLTPGAGAKKKSMNEEYDIIKKIDNTLMNKSVLVQKSQQVKNVQAPTNDSDAENQGELTLNANIYDDTEFYHQQLRELIEYKANTSNNMSEVTKQFLELQKLRQKMKKKVDTRASKGRKIRYVVHNKLINFMAPHDNSTWTEESKDELCKSLFV